MERICLDRTSSDKMLHNKIFNIAKKPNYDGYQSEFASVVFKFLNENTSEVNKPKKSMSR